MSAAIQTEIDALRAQLAEAEDLRRAIQRAEVDGFIIGDGDGDRYVQLLGPAYARGLAERQRRYQETDERTRRFLGMLAVELLAMLKGMKGGVALVKREKQSGDARRALESLERYMATMQRLVEDLRTINPRE